MAALRYLDDGGQVQTYKLGAEQVEIGRADSCQITIESEMISREHARIVLTPEGRFRVVDLGSRNKTYVNGEQITETVLTPGDILRVGDRLFEFVDESTVAGITNLEFLTPEKGDAPGVEWLRVKQPISLSIAQLERIAQLGSNQPLTARAEEIASNALGRAILDLGGERGLVALRGEKKTDLRPVAHRGLQKSPGGSLTPVSESFVLAPILQQVAGLYPQNARQIDTKLGYAAAAVVAPLTYRGDIVGVLYVDRPSGRRPFPTESLPYAVAAGAQIGSLLGEAASKVSRSATRESAAWMTTTRRTQRALSTELRSNDSFQVTSCFFPGRVRCGDLASVVHVDDQRSAIMLVDGGGHGITGIAQAASIRTALTTCTRQDDDAILDPSGMFNTLNTLLGESDSRQVIPVLFVGIDLAAGKLSYINAGGMPPLLLLRAGRLLTLDQTSLVLGVDNDYMYEATRVDLPDTFRIACFTDGLTEAASPGGDTLGRERLHDSLLDREAFVDADEIISRIEKLWKSHLSGAQGDDDATAVVLARGRAPA